MNRTSKTLVGGLMRPTAALVVVALVAALCGSVTLTRAQETAGFGAGDAVVVDTDYLNLRTDAGLSAAVTTVLIDGTFATVTGGPTIADGYTWYALDVDGAAGWAAGEYLTLAGEFGFLPLGTYVAVTSDTVNFRDAPGLGGAVITTLDTGAVAAVVDGPESADGYNWYLIDADGTTGWMVRDFLAFAPPAGTFVAGTTALVNTDALNLRNAVGLDAGVVDTLAGGAIVTIVSGPTNVDGFAWYEVSTDLGDGFVAGDFLVAI